VNDARLNASVGLKLRSLRLTLGLKQADVARQIGVSPAYLNLIEKGKRVIPFPLLWKALRLYEQDPEQFMATLGEGTVDEALGRLLEDPLLRSLDLDAGSLEKLTAEPRLIGTVAALFNLYKNTRSQLDNVLQRMSAEDRSAPGAELESGYSPFDEVVDFLEANRNFFPELEEEAEALRRDASLPRQCTSEDLKRIVEKRFRLEVRDASLPRGSVVRRLDREQGTLQLSDMLTEQPRKFQLAASMGLMVLDRTRLVQRITGGTKARHAETARLIKVNLANYFAGALLLPYADFFKEVQRTRWDVEALEAIFGVTYETVAHRMCNLADPKRRGVPLHFLRADVAGNISKRYSATGLRFAGQGGSCPKWAVHVAFLTPSILRRQFSIMPDGTTYFCFAKAQVSPVEGSVERGTAYSIGMGVVAEDAKLLSYGAGMSTSAAEIRKHAIPAGISCRFCERTDCNQRAAPSYRYAFAFDEYTKKDSFFSPLLNREGRERPPPGRK
jgi:predicted transcriptional regulator/DNA-binding XRE family transcriptional regulator